jgi:arabinofuranosyltransferase
MPHERTTGTFGIESVSDRFVNRRIILAIVVAATAIGVMVLHAFRYYPFLSDDALISLRYADRFIRGLGLTWNDGERVEGYSNLLWILASSGLGALGIDLVAAVRILGVACTALAILAITMSCARTKAFSVAGMVGGSLFLALSGPIAVWAVGGLEQPLVAGLLAVACTLSLSMIEDCGTPRMMSALAPGLLYGLLGITRPDGILFGGLAFVSLVVAGPVSGQAVMRALLFGVAAALPFLGQLGFRLAYYGEWVPNTALVKLSIGAKRASEGLDYLMNAAVFLAPLVIVGGLALLFLLYRKRWRTVVFLALPAIGWAAYVVLIGGDIFPAHRHAVPLIVIASLAVAEALVTLEPERWSIKAPALVMVACALAVHAWLQFQDPSNRRAIDERWEFKGQVLATLLKKAFGDRQPLITVDAAGCIAYYTGFPAVDMYGLNDKYIAQHPPANMGQGVIGHELGDGRYALDRNPDIFVFHIGLAEPSSPGDVQAFRTREFHDKYEKVLVEGEDPFKYRGVIWVNRTSPKVGIRKTDTGGMVPAYLFRGDVRNVARIGPGGRLAMEVNRYLPSLARSLLLECGTWKFTVQGNGVPVAVSATSAEGNHGTATDALVVRIAEPRELTLYLQPASPESAFIEEVKFEKMEACSAAPRL